MLDILFDARIVFLLLAAPYAAVFLCAVGIVLMLRGKKRGKRSVAGRILLAVGIACGLFAMTYML